MTDVEVWTSTPELDALAVTIREEYRLANLSAISAVCHAILGGEALLQARSQLPRGGWLRWLTANVEMNPQTANQWCRLARNKHLLQGYNGTNIKQAMKSLSAMGAESAPTTPGPTWDVGAAHQLRDQGLSYAQIAAVVGVSKSAVMIKFRRDLSADDKRAAHQRAKRRRAEKAALARQERDAAVKKVGGDISVLYAWIRQGAVMVDRAIIDADDSDYREAMREAQAALTKVEDAIVKALRVR